MKSLDDLRQAIEQNYVNKMNLVLDLDHTLLHAIDEYILYGNAPQAQCKKKLKQFTNFIKSAYQKNYHSFSFGISAGTDFRKYNQHMILRPGVDKLFEELSPYFTIFVNTKGRYEYAMEIIKILDPEDKYNIRTNVKASFSVEDQNSHKNLGEFELQFY